MAGLVTVSLIPRINKDLKISVLYYLSQLDHLHYFIHLSFSFFFREKGEGMGRGFSPHLDVLLPPALTLLMRPRISTFGSVGRSVGRSVGWSVHLLVTHSLKTTKIHMFYQWKRREGNKKARVYL